MIFNRHCQDSNSQPVLTTCSQPELTTINIPNLCNDILSSEIFKVPITTLHSYLETFTSTLSSLLDKHAPLKNISCSSKTKNHSSLLTFDLKRPNAQSWKPFTVDLGGPLIFKISKSNRLLFINSYLTLAAHITAQSF